MPQSATSPTTVVPAAIAAALNPSSLRIGTPGQASLRLRLMLAWLAFVLVVLNGAALAVKILFERSLKHSATADLSIDLRRLATGLELQANGTVKLAEVPAAPQFVVAHSGKYWQVSEAGKPLFRSPSLWAHILAIPPLPPGTNPRSLPIEVRLAGPDDQSLFGIARTVHIGEGPSARMFQIVSAIDDTLIVAAVGKFSSDLLLGMGLLAALLSVAAAALVTIGLRPLATLRERLSWVRNGDSTRITGDFPSEVMPLVAETNALLAAQDDAIDVARTQRRRGARRCHQQTA
jgi:hypothetical protein